MASRRGAEFGGSVTLLEGGLEGGLARCPGHFRLWPRYLPLSACFIVLLGFGCSRQAPAPDITIAHQINPEPIRAGLTEITLTVADSASAPVTGAHIDMEADMSHAGMAPVFAQASEITPGRYRGKINLNMGGDWVILLHGTLSDGAKFERQFDLMGVQSK
ncbi:MAG TPA: FixH family protein [Terriglobales bacterium]